MSVVQHLTYPKEGPGIGFCLRPTLGSAFFPEEFLVDLLDPFRGWTRPLHYPLLCHANPIHDHDHTRVIHHSHHAREDPFQSFPEALEVERALEAGNLNYGFTVEEQFVNRYTRVGLGVCKTDAHSVGVDTGQGPDECLPR